MIKGIVVIVNSIFAVKNSFCDVHTAHHILRVRLALKFCRSAVLKLFRTVKYTHESRFGNWDEVVTRLS